MRFFILLLLLGSARAEEPVLHVKARTRLDLASVVRVPGGIVVRGTLFDAALEEPIPGRTVAISVDGPNGFYRYAEPTADDGSFRWRVPLPLGQYNLRLVAGGDEEYAPAVVERALDVERVTPILTLIAPESVSIQSLTVDVTVELRDPENDGERLDLPVTLLAGGRALAAGRTAGGQWAVSLPVHELGPAGAQVAVLARFDGDERFNPAQATRSLLLTTPTRLTLAAGSERISADEEVRLSGALTDAAGPVALGVVDSEVARKTVASAVTGKDGRFSARLRGAALGTGRVVIEARFRPQSGFREASRSEPLELTVHAASLRANPVYLIPPLLTALALAGLALARRRPWATVAARLRARARPALSSGSSGLSEGRTRILGTLRPANDFGLAGLVCDGVTHAPISGATLVVDVGGQHRSALSDEQGRFALEGLPAGTLAVEVAAAGYVSERFHRTVPHRGELRGARVLLSPIRARIFAAYDRAARPLAPRPNLIEIWTPRELLRHVRSYQLLTNELAELTGAVESSCYGPRPPDLDQLAEVERLVEKVKPAGG